jgi:hypothetical protein
MSGAVLHFRADIYEDDVASGNSVGEVACALQSSDLSPVLPEFLQGLGRQEADEIVHPNPNEHPNGFGELL